VDARVVIEGFPHAFDDLRVVLLAYPGEIVIDDLRARLAGGTLRASGSLRLPGGEAGDELTYRVQARAEDVALRYPEGWLVRGDVELVLSSQPGGRQIRGVADLESAVYLRDIDVGLAQLLRGFFARQRLQVAETEEFLATTFLNVAVHAPGALRVSNNVAKLRGSADLTLRGTLASPVVFGHVEAEPGGELVYGDNEYEVTRARLSFANPYRIEPLIDLEAHSRVSQYDVRLELVGPLDRLNATFTSDPPIPDLEILSLIATGDTSLAAERPGLGPAAGGEAGLAGAASVGAEAFLAGQAASLVGERVNRLFRFDRFRVAPLAASGESISAVRVTAGEQISKDLYVTYSINPLVTEDQVLSLEWSVARNLSLIFTQNGDGTYAVDAQWAKAF
jgi:translocation and assembly module TamB